MTTNTYPFRIRDEEEEPDSSRPISPEKEKPISGQYLGRREDDLLSEEECQRQSDKFLREEPLPDPGREEAASYFVRIELRTDL